jgi:hypothetical protein
VIVFREFEAWRSVTVDTRITLSAQASASFFPSQEKETQFTDLFVVFIGSTRKPLRGGTLSEGLIIGIEN